MRDFMARKKILLADDEEDVRDIVRMFLEGEGYEVVTAYDGLEALSMIEAEHPDLILLDVMMPVMSGIEVARRLRANHATSQIPVIMLSAAAQTESIKQCIAAGVKDYVVKPFQPSKLEEIIRRVLAGAEVAGADRP